MNMNINRTVDYDVKCYEGVKIKLKYLTTGETKDVTQYIPAGLDIEGNIKTSAKVAYDTIKMLKYMVIEVDTLTLTEGKKVTEIKTGSDIAKNPGLDKLYAELIPVLLKMDARVDAKN